MSSAFLLRKKQITFETSPILVFPCGITVSATVAKTALATWLGPKAKKPIHIQLQVHSVHTLHPCSVANSLSETGQEEELFKMAELLVEKFCKLLSMCCLYSKFIKVRSLLYLYVLYIYLCVFFLFFFLLT